MNASASLAGHRRRFPWGKAGVIGLGLYVGAFLGLSRGSMVESWLNGRPAKEYFLVPFGLCSMTSEECWEIHEALAMTFFPLVVVDNWLTGCRPMSTPLFRFQMAP